MSLLSQLFGKYSLLAKEIYENYLQDREPISKEDVNIAVSQYEKDHNVHICPYVQVLKRKIMEKDFTPSESYFRVKGFLKEKWLQAEQTKKKNQQLKKAYIAQTNTIIHAVKDDVIEDKVFISQVLCFSLALAYKKEYRRYMMLKGDEDTTIHFLEYSPEDYYLFKIGKIRTLLQKRAVPDNQYRRIITQMMRFIKDIERG